MKKTVLKSYKLKLKGTKKHRTENLTLIIKGENKNQAFSWAYQFFQQGEFKEPYYAAGIKRMSGGTEEFIPGAKSMMHLAGKYNVPRTAITVNKL